MGGIGIFSISGTLGYDGTRKSRLKKSILPTKLLGAKAPLGLPHDASGVLSC